MSAEQQTHGTEATTHFLMDHVDRVDYIRNKSEARLLFYKHKISYLLFPDYFIEVTGISTKANTNKSRLKKTGLERHLTSKMAQVPDYHAIFTKHSKETFNHTYCECPQCLDHAQFHTTQKFISTLTQVVAEISGAGIVVPYKDLTDYCMGPKGIVFFEILHIDSSKLVSYLQKQDQTEDIKEVLRLHEELGKGL